MAIYQKSGALKTLSTINLLAGIWMIITPYALGGGAAAEWNGVIFGCLLVICSIGRLAAPAARGYSVANVVWGVWLILSPWALGMAGAGMRWSNDVTGIIVVICAWAAVRQVPVVMAFPESGAGPTRRAA